MSGEESRNRLWNEIHESFREFVLPEDNQKILKANLRVLRTEYRSMNNSSLSPRFSSKDMRDAYMVAYHPGHAYLSHNVLCRISEELAYQEQKNYTVTVLGAGCAAEILAFLQWAITRESVCEKVTVNLVDVQDWTAQRKIGLFPLVNDYLESGFLEIISFQTDVCSSNGRELINQLVPQSNLVITPALFTELTDDCRNKLFDLVLKALNPTGLLLIMDQSEVSEFRPWIENKSKHVGKIAVIALEDLVRRVPGPPIWLREQVLDGTDGLIPRSKYKWTWMLCMARHHL